MNALISTSAGFAFLLVVTGLAHAISTKCLNVVQRMRQHIATAPARAAAYDSDVKALTEDLCAALDAGDHCKARQIRKAIETRGQDHLAGR